MAQRVRHAAAQLVCAGLLVAGPAAADVSFRGFFSQRFEADLGPDSTGSGSGGDDGDRTLRSTTDLGTIFSSASPTTTLTLAPGIRGILSTDEDQDSRILPRFNSSVALRGPRHTLTGGLAFVPDFVSATDFTETGVVDQNVIQFDLSGTLGLTYRVDTRNSLTASAFARLRDYSEDTESLTANVSAGGGLTWSRTLDPRTTGNLSLNYRQFIPQDDETGTGITTDTNDRRRTQTMSLTAGFDRALTPSFDLGASAGLSLTGREASDTGDSDSTDIGFVGSLSASYDATEDTRFTLSLNQSVEPDSQGIPETRTSLGASMSSRINETQSFALNLRSVLNATSLDSDSEGRDGDGDSGPRFEVGASYNLALTQNWNASVGYTLRFQEEDDSNEISNRVFFTISRAISFLP